MVCLSLVIDWELVGRLRWAQWTHMVTGCVPTWVEHVTWQEVEPVVFYLIRWLSILQVLPGPIPIWVDTRVDISSWSQKHIVLYCGCACVTSSYAKYRRNSNYLCTPRFSAPPVFALQKSCCDSNQFAHAKMTSYFLFLAHAQLWYLHHITLYFCICQFSRITQFPLQFFCV